MRDASLLNKTGNPFLFYLQKLVKYFRASFPRLSSAPSHARPGRYRHLDSESGVEHRNILRKGSKNIRTTLIRKYSQTSYVCVCFIVLEDVDALVEVYPTQFEELGRRKEKEGGAGG